MTFANCSLAYITSALPEFQRARATYVQFQDTLPWTFNLSPKYLMFSSGIQSSYTVLSALPHMVQPLP